MNTTARPSNAADPTLRRFCLGNMIQVTDQEISMIAAGDRRIGIYPDRDVAGVCCGEVHELHVGDPERCYRSGKYVVVLKRERGTLDHWLHHKPTMESFGFAHPHEFADHIRNRFHWNPLDNAQEPWIVLRWMFLDDWIVNDKSDLYETAVKFGFYFSASAR